MGGAEVDREEDQGEAHHVSAHVEIRSPFWDDTAVIEFGIE